SLRRWPQRRRGRRWPRARLCAGARSAAGGHRARLYQGAQGAAQAAELRATLERVGRRLWRLGPYQRRSRGGGEARAVRPPGRAAGGAAGLDYHLSRNSLVGFALAGGGTNWSLAQGLGGGKSDAFQAGLYGASRWGPTYLAAALAYTNHWMSTDRFAFAGDHL